MAYNILLVDDSSIVRAVMAKTLRIAEVSVGELFTACNGVEALDVLKEQWIDLVITDLNMPEMDGFELVDAMCADENMKTIPIIVVSTEGSTTRIEELKQKGVRGYVRKPFTPEQVREIITEIMGAI